MKYMLLIYGAENCWTEDERTECMLKSMAVCDELQEQGKWLASSPLHSVTTATCVRVRDGNRQVTDGPYAETTEQLGWLLPDPSCESGRGNCDRGADSRIATWNGRSSSTLPAAGPNKRRVSGE